MTTDKTFSITKKELLEKAKSLAKPIDFDDLIARKILEKKGSKYKILSIEQLPLHARDKLIQIDSEGYVKFSKATKSAEKLVKKLSK